MQITSPAFQNNGMLPKDYSCDGAGVNPPLQFSDVPADAKSLVLIVDDPDAPMGNFVHWVVYNIPANTVEIAQNSVPNGSMQGVSGTGKAGFVGACPPSGQHRYFFTLYALSKVIGEKNLDTIGLKKAMDGQIIAQSELIGLYKRQ